MRISLCIATITISAVFATARPLNEGAVVASDPKIEWTDLMPSSNAVNELHAGSSSYKEFEHAADQQEEEKEGWANDYKPNGNIDLNREAPNLTRGDDVDDTKTSFEHGQLDSQTAAKETSDKNSISSDTRFAFDIIMKPSESEAQEPHSDTTVMDAGTRNAFSKNEIASDTTDYANREALDKDGSMPTTSHQQDEVLLPPMVQMDESKKDDTQEESTRFDFIDALDQALLDPSIPGIDPDLNNQVYESPVAEVTAIEDTTNGDIPDYTSLIAEQIRSAEEQVRIKHVELIQDQQQIDDLKRKIHHPSPATATILSLSNPTFSMAVVESGPDEIMYVYKPIQPTPIAITAQQQPDLGTSVIHSPPPSPQTKTPDLETNHQELRAEQNVPSSVIHNTPLYNVVQQQTDEEDYYQTKIKKGSASAVVEAVDLVIPPHMGGTAFDPSNKLKLPNGSWTPSCKHVSKGLYCLQPDGRGSTIIECSGENVGFQFSCGKNMLCYSTGPFDVDCQKTQDFIKGE
ncbi:hypothetical protein MAM1_0052c03446 [Mucor ambiguus]|uniref:Carbohydrate-binding module family 19 domain-containing protein n=1 Tax=Mucor ambiguus TaxID=91626 RepID=A0A0C9LTS5_9FUNG|nr:hypothetical protein MAM1_0052c03446 [Mucor ambiguus]